MALRGTKPTAKPRARVLLSGDSGVGKTKAVIQFPNAYIIDNETGCEHYGPEIDSNGGVVFANKTGSMEEAIKEIHELMNTKHGFTMMVIDPLTVLYEESVAEGASKKGDAFGKHQEYAARQMARLMRLIADLDMNVIMTSHAKVHWKDGEAIGESFDGWKKSAYVVDLHLHISKDKHGRRIAEVKKTRLPEFADGDKFEWSYAAFESRYGSEKLERKAKPSKRASAKQVAELEGYLAQLSDEDNTRLGIDRALRGYAENLADLPEAKCKAGIDAISSYLGGAKKIGS